MMPRLIAGALLCASLSAHAIHFVESGDLPDAMSFDPASGAVSVGTLDVGANTVSGQLNGSCVLGPGGCNSFFSGDAQDSFLITVAAGTQLDSITVASIGTTGPAGFSASFYLTNQPASIIGGLPFIPVNGTSGNVLAAPLAAGVYSLSVYGQNASEAGAYVLPYTLSLGVSAVPEPASAALLLCGGLLLAARRRR